MNTVGLSVLEVTKCFYTIMLSQERGEKVVLHIADVGQGTAILIECRTSKDEGMI